MYNDKLVYKVVIWIFLGISLWKEKVALNASFMLVNKYLDYYVGSILSFSYHIHYL